jgi:hypothetical protein
LTTVCAARFHLLKMWLGSPALKGFGVGISSQMWPAKHFMAWRLAGVGLSRFCRVRHPDPSGLGEPACRWPTFFGAWPNLVFKEMLEAQSPATFAGVPIQNQALGPVSGQGQCAHALPHVQ